MFYSQGFFYDKFPSTHCYGSWNFDLADSDLFLPTDIKAKEAVGFSCSELED